MFALTVRTRLNSIIRNRFSPASTLTPSLFSSGASGHTQRSLYAQPGL